MRKNILNILLMTVLMALAHKASAQDIEANGIFYNIIGESQVEVAPAYYDGANHYKGCIILPERVYCDGVNYDVTAIAPRAFWQSAVTEVQIPNSITSIGEAAFADAEDLTGITLPLGLTAVSRYMLAGTQLTSIVLPEGVTDIGTGAFEDCTSLQTVFMPIALQTIGDRAFRYCTNLTEIYSDATVPPLIMGDATFEGCSGIHLTLGDNATAQDYEDDEFWGNEDLFSLWINERLYSMPLIEQEYLGQNWTALSLQENLAYKIYGPDGYLVALTAAPRYFLPIGAASTDYLVVPTTLMRDEEELQRVATAEPIPAELTEEETGNKISILGLDGTIHIEGDTSGMWTFVYDMYGNIWYEQQNGRDWFSLPGNRIYIVRVGDTVRKLLLR